MPVGTCDTPTVAPTRFSPANDFTKIDKLLVVTWATSEKLANVTIASKNDILLSIKIDFRLQRNGIFPK